MKPTLREGARDPASMQGPVRELQRLLIAAGQNPGPVDGHFGPKTYVAVTSYQLDQGLGVDGIVGPRTWAKLEGRAAPSQPPPSQPPSTGTDPHVEVARAGTPLSEAGLREALIQGHVLAFRGPAPPNRIGVAWAHVCLENARGQAIWNGNIGNITDHKCPAYYVLAVPPPDPPKLAFCAHTDPAEGAADYWKLLVQPRYVRALRLFDAGEAYAAGVELGERGYYLDPRRVGYGRSMASLFAEYQRKWPEPAEVPHEPRRSPEW